MLHLKNIYFEYPGKSGVFKVQVDSAMFKPTDITCILGKNGSGKTTLLNLIGGHLKPQKGLIQLFDDDISLLAAESRPTATVFQQIGLFPHLTVEQNIQIAIEPNRIFGVSAATKAKTSEILEQFNLRSLMARKPHQLSIGQQQRVAIARAVSTSPRVLLMDEPTSALDFFNIRALQDLVHELKHSGIVPIIVVVSHDLHFVLSIADNVKFIEDGALAFDGGVEDFKRTEYCLN